MPHPPHILNRAELARLNRQIVVDDNQCWLWQGTQSKNGYAYASRGPGHPKRVVHRILWEHHNNQLIPEGMQLDHLCRVRQCVNPDHFEVVTPSENTMRQEHSNRGKTHCPKGHEYDTENTRITSTGRRVCRACDRARERSVTEVARAEEMAPAPDGGLVRGPVETPFSRREE